MKKTLLAGLATVLFLLTSIGIAKDWPLAQEDMKNSKTTGLYDNVTILQEQINSLTERIGRIETLQGVGPRFTDKGDGTIIDNDSGLIWLKKANCFPYTMTWSDAKAHAHSLQAGSCGLDDGSAAGDWRLPTKSEWDAFLGQKYWCPCLANTAGSGQWKEGDAFTGVVSEWHWSSTHYVFPDEVWLGAVDGCGTWTDSVYLEHYLWPVRSPK